MAKGYVTTSLLFSNVTDANHQNSCLFTNKGHFTFPLWVLIGVLAQFHENTLPIAKTSLLEYISTITFFTHMPIRMLVGSLYLHITSTFKNGGDCIFLGTQSDIKITTHTGLMIDKGSRAASHIFMT